MEEALEQFTLEEIYLRPYTLISPLSGGDSLENRLSLTYLYNQKGQLVESDRFYLQDEQFPTLYQMSDQELAQEVVDRDLLPLFPEDPHRFQIIRTLIENNALPPDLQMMKSSNAIFISGKTYPYRLEFKRLGGYWDPEDKQWIFPLSRFNDLIEYFQQIQPSKKTLSHLAQIEVVSQIPPEKFGLYRYKNRIYLCGNTYAFKEEIKAIGGKWNPQEKCWSFPLSQGQEVIDLYQKIEPSLAAKALLEVPPAVPEAEIPDEDLIKLALDFSEEREEENQTPFSEELSEVAEKYRLPLDIENPTGPAFDPQRLKEDWNRVIRLIRYLPSTRSTESAILTYEGQIKPPDPAFAYWLEGWEPSNFGWNVEKIGPKEYKVTIFTD